MIDQSAQSPNPPSTNPPPPTWREQRHAERLARRQRLGWVGPGIGGIVLVIMGFVLLAQNFGAQLPDNWWAAFLLIPAVGAFVAVSRLYQEHGHLNAEALVALIGGIVLTLLATSLYFDFGWGLIWPAILIAIGAGILIRTYWRSP